MTRSGWLSGGIGRAVLAVGVGAVLFVLLGGAASRGATCSVNWTGLGTGRVGATSRTGTSRGARCERPRLRGASGRIADRRRRGRRCNGREPRRRRRARHPERLAHRDGPGSVERRAPRHLRRRPARRGRLVGDGHARLDRRGMAGTGTTTVAAGATLTVDAPTARFRCTAAERSSTRARSRGRPAPIFAGEGAVLENAGTFTVSNDGQVSLGYGGSALIHNTGTFSKTGGAGTTLIGVAMQNDGTLIATAGTLALQGGGGVETGSFGGSGGGTVSFDGGTFTLGAGASLPGTVAITNGTVDVAASVSAGSGSSVSQSGGTVDGHRHARRRRRLSVDGRRAHGRGDDHVAPAARSRSPRAGARFRSTAAAHSSTKARSRGRAARSSRARAQSSRTPARSRRATTVRSASATEDGADPQYGHLQQDGRSRAPRSSRLGWTTTGR